MDKSIELNGKILQLLRSGTIPAVKVGKDYLTTEELIKDWITKHIGEEVYF